MTTKANEKVSFKVSDIMVLDKKVLNKESASKNTPAAIANTISAPVTNPKQYEML